MEESQLIHLLKEYELSKKRNLDFNLYKQLKTNLTKTNSNETITTFLKTKILDYFQKKNQFFGKPENKKDQNIFTEKKEQYVNGRVCFKNPELSSIFCKELKEMIRMVQDNNHRGDLLNEFTCTPNYLIRNMTTSSYQNVKKPLF